MEVWALAQTPGDDQRELPEVRPVGQTPTALAEPPEPDTATVYADVYFDVNGFEEAGTGERGVLPAIIQAGRDTLVAYFLTQPGVEFHLIASFYGEKPAKLQRYVSRVRKRAAGIRDGAKEQGLV